MKKRITLCAVSSLIALHLKLQNLQWYKYNLKFGESITSCGMIQLALSLNLELLRNKMKH